MAINMETGNKPVTGWSRQQGFRKPKEQDLNGLQKGNGQVRGAINVVTQQDNL